MSGTIFEFREERPVSFIEEDELRSMVRASIARALGTASGQAPGHPTLLAPPPPGHASHYRYVLPESDGPCLIEPTVQCNHCGYCQSHGH
jgi:hypothetical protein